MASKFSRLLVVLCLIGSAAFAQEEGSGYDPMDSSVVPSRRLPQHTEFLANNYAFPAKPRSQWELGLKLGAFAISGDVPSNFPGFGVGLHVRKALGYVFSVRGELGYGNTKGTAYSKSNNYIRNPAWQPYITNGIPSQDIFYNYKSTIWDFSIQGVVNINNINFHRAQNRVNLYGFAGLGAMIYDTKVDALDGANLYNFSNVPSGNFDNRRDSKKAVKDFLDGEYETEAESDASKGTLFGEPFRPLLTFGVGLQFKLSPKLSLALEDRVGVPLSTDLLDGQQWQGNSIVEPAQTRDYDTYNFASLGINIAIGGARRVEPLWWINPLDYAYTELNQPRHMKIPKPVLDDADGDGVTDQFDNEPNTPAGAPVDAHGVSRDTDGDGVPDARDKELITPTQCQPVDADGVGKCPPPDCCKMIDSLMEYGVRGRCNIGDLPSITFRGKSVTLNNDARALMTQVASKIRENSSCKIAVVGYCSSSKSEQQLSWDRVNAVINYLVEKEGISQDRFIFKYGQEGGDCNTVDLRDGSQEEGPTTVPAPHPNLRRR